MRQQLDLKETQNLRLCDEFMYCWEASMKFSRIGRRLWRRPRPKLDCGAKGRERWVHVICVKTRDANSWGWLFRVRTLCNLVELFINILHYITVKLSRPLQITVRMHMHIRNSACVTSSLKLPKSLMDFSCNCSSYQNYSSLQTRYKATTIISLHVNLKHNKHSDTTAIHLTWNYTVGLQSGASLNPAQFTLSIRRCIQKFPDWVDNEINNNKKKHSLRSNTKGYGGKTH
jgi:hypothetical protein